MGMTSLISWSMANKHLMYVETDPTGPTSGQIFSRDSNLTTSIVRLMYCSALMLKPVRAASETSLN